MPNASHYNSIKFRCLSLLVCILLGVSAPTVAGVISPGTPTTTVPAALDDPLSTLTSPLPAGQFLLPIEITGALGLQDWSFDLGFDDSVVAPLDVFGLSQWVYPAEFNAADTTKSNITSAGFLFPDLLDDIAGFSSGVSGDGLLAFVLFQFLPGQEGNEPDFSIPNQSVTETAVPEPGTLALFATALLMVAFARRRLGRVRLSNAR